MIKKNSNFLNAIPFIAVIILILTWPQINLLVKFDDGNLIKINYPQTATLHATAWNRGGIVSNTSIITPESCISLIVDNNIECSHESYIGNISCSIPKCSYPSAGSIASDEVITFKFEDKLPTEFSFNITADSHFSLIHLSTITQRYKCEKDEKLENIYKCLQN